MRNRGTPPFLRGENERENQPSPTYGREDRWFFIWDLRLQTKEVLDHQALPAGFLYAALERCEKINEADPRWRRAWHGKSSDNNAPAE
jgi:hypothetical protein